MRIQSIKVVYFILLKHKPYMIIQIHINSGERFAYDNVPLESCVVHVALWKTQVMFQVIRAAVILLLSAVVNLVGLTFLLGPHMYCCLGAVNMKFAGIRAVLTELPALPTDNWNALSEPGFKTPLLQQLAIC